VLVAPSPKFHNHDVGYPAVVSANCTGCPGPGVAGLKTKVAAAEAGKTARVFVAFLDPVPLATTSETLRNPGVS